MLRTWQRTLAGTEKKNFSVNCYHVSTFWEDKPHLMSKIWANTICRTGAGTKISKLTNMLAFTHAEHVGNPPHTFCLSLCSLTCSSLYPGHPSPNPIAFQPFMCQQNYHGEASLSQMNVFSLFGLFFCPDVYGSICDPSLILGEP